MPPLTSADVLMYAAYGRLQAIGMDPYDITPAEVFRSQFDPVLEWTERPWQDTPSVYGPITSWTQLMANRLGGENMHDIVFWLQLCSAIPFIIVGLGAILLAHGDSRRQARAALLVIANPVLIWAVVAGAHNEALSVMFAVAGLLFMRKNPFVAGLGIGLAGSREAEHRAVGTGHALVLPPRTEEGRPALPRHRHPDGPGVRGLAAERVLPGAAQRRLRVRRLLGQSGLPLPGPVHDRAQRQDHRRDHLLRRPDRDRLDAVPHRALDGGARAWPRARTCARIR